MTTGFGILDLPPPALQDQRFAVGFHWAEAFAIWTGELSLTGCLLSPLQEIAAGEFSSNFVPDFDSQMFDVQKRLSFSQR